MLGLGINTDALRSRPAELPGVHLALLLCAIEQGEDFLKGRDLELSIKAAVGRANPGNPLPGA